MKKLFLLDYKKIDDNNELSRINNSVYQILKRYALDIVDYENNELTEAIFIRLGWSNKYKDTIFSFFRTICAILEYFSKENEIKLDDGSRIVFYHQNNILKYKINENEYQYSTKKQIPDLTGEWKQENSKSDDSYQAATISGDTITIYWVSDKGDTKSLYWAGSFVAPTTAAEPYSWTSKNDHSKTEGAMLASNDDTKTMTYQNGVLSYEASAMGTTTTVKLKKQQ